MPKIMNAGAPPAIEGLGEYEDKILILVPTDETTIETSFSANTKATKVVAMWFNEDTNKVEDIGEQLVFWSRVRAQLAEALVAKSVYVGRLTKHGRAFQLDPVEDATLKTIEKQLL